jgi:hypothetical protein
MSSNEYRQVFIREHQSFIEEEVKRLDTKQHNKTTNKRHTTRLRTKIIDDMISQQTEFGYIPKVEKSTYFSKLIQLDPVVKKSGFWKLKLQEMDRNDASSNVSKEEKLINYEHEKRNIDNNIVNASKRQKTTDNNINNHHLTEISGTDPKLTILRLFTNLMYANFKNQTGESEARNRDFVRKLNEKDYPKGQQQDAHEFMMRLLTWLLANLNHARVKVGLQLNGLEAGLSIQSAEELLDDLYISLKQTSTCDNGHIVESIIEKEILSFDINFKNDINECITRFFSTEKLPPCICRNNIINNMCNAFKCDTCGKHVNAQKRFTIKKFPKYLIMNLKIFSPNNNHQVNELF